MLLRNDQEARIVLGDNNGAGMVHSRGYRLESEPVDHQIGLESPIHPLGIKPLGNKLLSDATADAREAIGAFQALPDGTDMLVAWIPFFLN